MKKMVMFSALVVSAMCGCTCNKQPKESFETLEEQRKIARENAKVVAFVFRGDNKLEGYEVISAGDSTIGPDCPQGDGWASLTLKDIKTGREDIKIKCSTVSLGIGCLEEKDFRLKEQRQVQEGKCNPDIPFPLPKIAN